MSSLASFQKKIVFSLFRSILTFVIFAILINLIFILLYAKRIWEYNRPGGEVVEMSIALCLLGFLFIGIPLIYVLVIKRRMVSVVVVDGWQKASQEICTLVAGKVSEYCESHQINMQTYAQKYEDFRAGLPRWLKWTLHFLNVFLPVVESIESLISYAAEHGQIEQEKMSEYLQEKLDGTNSSASPLAEISQWIVIGVVVMHMLFLGVVMMIVG